jgi:hypothetical protein
MLTATGLVRFQHFWKFFARTPHCDFHGAVSAYALKVFADQGDTFHDAFHALGQDPVDNIQAFVDFGGETIC